MLNKCANPQCSATFHILGEGKVYEVRSIGPRGSDSNLNGAEERPGSLEHFWLCEQCSKQMAVAVDRKRNVSVIPLPRVHHAVAS